MEKLNVEREKLRTEMQKTRETIAAEINKTLTEEQKSKLEEFKKNRKHGKRESDNLESRLEKMKKELSLTPEQTESVRKALDEHIANIKKLRMNEKGEKRDEKAMKLLKAENEKFKAKLKTILSSEQMQKLQDRRKKRVHE